MSASEFRMPGLPCLDAYGVLLNTTGTGIPNLYLYTGEQWDADLGMYFLRARYLNPETGRFHTMDTFEGVRTDPQSLHKYLYAHANPVVFVDPSGNISLIQVSVGIALGSILIASIDPYGMYASSKRCGTGKWTGRIEYAGAALLFGGGNFKGYLKCKSGGARLTIFGSVLAAGLKFQIGKGFAFGFTPINGSTQVEVSGIKDSKYLRGRSLGTVSLNALDASVAGFGLLTIRGDIEGKPHHDYAVNPEVTFLDTDILGFFKGHASNIHSNGRLDRGSNFELGTLTLAFRVRQAF